jgi:hypothetical protein
MGMHDRVFVAYERRDADEIRASGDRVEIEGPFSRAAAS